MCAVDIGSFKSQVLLKTPWTFSFTITFKWLLFLSMSLYGVNLVMHRLYVHCSMRVHFHLPQLIRGHHYLCSLYTLSNSFSACWSYLSFSCCFSVFVQHHLTASASECVCAVLWKWACLGCQSVSPLDLRVYSLTGKHKSTVVQRRLCCLLYFFLFYVSCDTGSLHLAAELHVWIFVCARA